MKRPLMMFCILCMVICVLLRICKSESPPGSLPEVQVSLQGQVTSIENRNNQTILFLSDIFLYGDSAEEITNDNINGVMCYCDGMHEIKLGQTIVVQGFLSLPKQAGNAGEFDALEYYKARGYEYLLKEAVIVKAGQKYDVLLQALYICKIEAKKQLYTFLKQEDAGIMTALLLGDKGGIESETKEAYRSAGIYHILAISGLHISLIGGFICETLKRFKIPSPIAEVTVIGVIILYGMMIGMPPSAFRAIFMFGMGTVAVLINRTHDRLTSLALAATCLIFGNPLLMGEAGFLLSFLAVMGIVCLYPTFTPIHSNKMPVLDSLWVSFAVTYFTLPAVMFFYYEVPMYSIILNCLILPFLPWLLGMGLTVIVLGGILPPVAKIVSYGIHLILLFYEKVLFLFEKLPGGNYVTGAPNVWEIILFYMAIGSMIYVVLRKKRKLYLYSLESENDYAAERQELYIKKQKEIRKKLCRIRVIQAAVMLISVMILLFSPKADLKITFLDVGQGDGICIETSEKTFLIDCGSTSKSGLGTYTLLPFLKHSGIKKIDGWFLTHPDKDHVSAFMELYEGMDSGTIRVDTLYIPETLEAEFEEIILLAEENHIDVVVLDRGEELIFEQLKFTVVSPDTQTYYSDGNAASLVLYLEYGPFDGLFTGDAGMEAEKLIEESDISEITLLKVAHHGSSIDTNTEAFIDNMSPEIAVISCGENNSYGHPHREVLERLMRCGSAIYRTDETGQISFIIRGNRISVKML